MVCTEVQGLLNLALILGLLTLWASAESLPPIHVSLSEGASIGSRHLLDIQTEGKFVDAQIVAGNEDQEFRLHKYSLQSSGALSLYLETRKKLDRETQDSYKLQAQLKRPNQENDIVNIHISLLDINDNPPVFEKSEYLAYLNYSQVISNVPIATVRATDKDHGRNGEISYFLSDGFQSNFYLERDTGKLFAKSGVFCNDSKPCLPCLLEDQQCSILVHAKDAGTPQQSSYTVVKVQSLDADEQRVDISIRHLPDHTLPFSLVDTNAKAGTTVAALTVTGSSDNEQVDLKITSRERQLFEIFKISAKLFVVRLREDLSEKNEEKYVLTIKASAPGGFPNYAKALLEVRVKESFESAIELEERNYKATIREDAKIGSAVITVQTKGNGPSMEYAIINGNELSWFRILPHSGMIVTSAFLDREIKEQWILNVQATLKSSYQNAKVNATVEIIIEDVNDNVPKFSESEEDDVEILADIQSNSVIYVANATDADKGSNGKVDYELLQSEVLPFEIDKSSGELRVTSMLQKKTYDLSILAQDNGNPREKRYLQLKVKVSHKNSEKLFFYPDKIYLTLADLKQTLIAPLQVTIHNARNEAVTFRFQEESSSKQTSFLNLNKNSGTFSLKKGFAPQPTTVTVVAKTENGREADQPLVIEIVPDENVIILDSKQLVITESANSQNEDFPPNPLLNLAQEFLSSADINHISANHAFEIVDGNVFGNFMIDQVTNSLMQVRPLDREKEEQISLKVAIFHNQKLLLKTFEIQVNDINDNPPVFIDSSVHEIIVDDRDPLFTGVYKPPISDPDAGENKSLSFILNDPVKELGIEPETGIIYLLQNIHESSKREREVEVTVKDQGYPQLTSSKLYHIKYKKANKFSPKFDYDRYDLYVSEDTRVNTIFASIIAVDEDLGLEGDLEYMIEGFDSESFHIFPNGDLMLAKPMDREVKDYYSLTVVAKDTGINERSASAKIIIMVEDENDHDPEFEKKEYQFKVGENEPPGTVVGRIFAKDPDSGRNSDLSYNFVRKNNLFSLDPSSGFITLAQQLNRERVFSDLGQDFYHLDVTVHDDGVFSRSDLASVTIAIVDKNDNAPVFFHSMYAVEVFEDAKRGSELLKVQARDDDKGDNGRTSYEILNDPDNMLGINASTGSVILQASLDRETKQKYEFILQASDNGKPKLSSQAKLVIKVQDVNDHSPVFEQTYVETEIEEDAQVGMKIFHFKANDLDEGENSEITYSIKGTEFRHLFHLDQSTGILYLKSKLDYELNQAIELIILAKDNGIPSRAATVNFLIRIRDVNDNYPVFEKSAITFTLNENVPIGSFVGKIIATDDDSGKNGKIKFYLEKKSEAFNLDQETGRIFTTASLDREEIAEYRLFVIAQDMGDPSLKARAEVIIDVSDINDSVPEIDSLTTALIYPNLSKNTPIIKVTAHDLDEGVNGKVTFQLIQTDTLSLPIEMDSKSGVVTLNSDLTVLDRDVYKFEVIAQDGAPKSSQMTSTTMLTLITSKPISDRYRFAQSPYETVLKENIKKRTKVLKLDLDGSFDGAKFYIVGCNKKSDLSSCDLFEIEESSGTIRTKRELDREEYGDRVSLQIVAVSIAEMAQCEVIISILDENDSPPEILDTSAVQVSEVNLPGQIVGRVFATDPDENPSLEYRIKGKANDLLAINSKTGEISLKVPVDKEEIESIDIEVSVFDGKHTTTWQHVVQIDDVNDNAPAFDQENFVFEIAENADRGAIVGKLQASDKDFSSAFNTLTYYFVSSWGSDVFEVNPSSGIISLASSSALDHEQTEHYIMIAGVKDSGSPPMTATTTVFINVLDVNDNPPKIASSIYNLKVREDSPVGYVVTNIKVTDPDYELNSGFRFEIEDGYDEKFSVSRDGTLMLKEPLDFEKESFMSFHVTVYEDPLEPEHLDAPILSSSCQINIEVEDVNDNVPKIFLVAQPEIMENSPVGTPIIKLEAIDEDSKENAVVEFALEKEAKKLFQVGKRDGILRSNAVFDREKQDQFVVTIIATDNGRPRLSSKTNITVHIGDENDNNPRFQLRRYSVQMAENASIGTNVADLRATDLDSLSGGKLRYRFIDGNADETFFINWKTGQVSTAKHLDYEKHTKHVMTAMVEDNDDKFQRSDTVVLEVEILDINDNAPVLEDSPYSVHVKENAELKDTSVVYKCNAKDIDGPDHNKIEYYLQDEHSDTFTIDKETGELHLLRHLDREENSQYLLNVIVKNPGFPSLSSTGLIQVTVLDDNDNAPKFDVEKWVFEVPENLRPGSPVGKVSAQDADDEANGLIRYSLNDSVPFQIDPETGAISTSQSIDREITSSYTFNVIATDQSLYSPKSGVAEVTVNISDDNDNPPEILNEQSYYYISSAAEKGSFVFGVKATDQDEGKNKALRFSISGRDSDTFFIHPITGVITLAKNDPSKISHQISVSVSDGGQKPLSILKDFEIIVTQDISLPSFGEFVERVRIPENQVIGTSVLTVISVEDDVEFGIAAGNNRGIFDIDQETGSLFLKEHLDYETDRFHEIWVKASFRNKPLFFDAKKVSIAVEDVNDHPPKFKTPSQIVHILEGQYPPAFVTQVRAFDLDSGRAGKIKYLIEDEALQEVFEIDSRNGKITCLRELDREDKNLYEFTVVAYDSGTPQLKGSLEVTVIVDDINDNAPVFSRIFNANVSENAPIGKEVLIIQVEDRDLPPHNNVSLKLLPTDGWEKFSIDSKERTLKIAGKLDRELKEEYELKVQASDGAWTVETVLLVQLLDENDNAPTFDSEQYDFVYDPKLDKRKTIGRVRAIDRDAPGMNSELEYSLRLGSPIFEIDSQDGMISFASGIPHNESPENAFRLVVVASDKGFPPKSATCEIIVSIVDEDSVDFPFDVKQRELAIPVNIPQGESLQLVEFENGAKVKFAMENGQTSEILSRYLDINDVDGSLLVKRPLAGLSGSTYALNISATYEAFAVQGRTHFSITISFTGANDHSPEFQPHEMVIQLKEDTPVGTEVIQLEAVDQDEGLNGKVSYEIIDGDPSRFFSIDPIAGSLITQKALDFEKIRGFNLTVQAVDMGFYYRATRTLLAVIIEDINDNAPSFERKEYRATVEENRQRGTEVITMKAMDPDSDPYNNIEYKLIEANDNFEINSITGLIRTQKAFNYEHQQQFITLVEARNPGSKLNSNVSLIIDIIDVNEFSPKFTQPIFQFSIAERSRKGTVVGKIKAVDSDAGRAGEVFYFFVGASNVAGFNLNRRTGEIIVDASLDRELQNRYILEVLAKNYGSIRGNNTDTAQVIIEVLDGNDPPVFRNDSYFAEVSEISSIGQFVVQVSAVDKDVIPRNSHFTYSIIDGNNGDAFHIDASNGKVTVASSLDRESKPLYTLKVAATDNGSPPAVGFATVRVKINDENDSPPYVENQEGFIKENAPPGSFVMRLNVTDPDLEPNRGPFFFSIIDGESYDLFKINETSGVITSLDTFDREKQAKHHLVVRVQDNGSPRQSASFSIEINVQDENDNQPEPREIDVIVKTFDGAFSGGTIAKLRPHDLDTDDQFRCEMLSGPENIFQIARDCSILAERIQNGREYQLSSTVTDGVHEPVTMNVTLSFKPFSRKSWNNSVPLLFSNVSKEDVLGFFLNLRPINDLQFDVLSLTVNEDGNIEALLALMRNGDIVPRFESVDLTKNIFSRLSLGKLNHYIVNYNPCEQSWCNNGGACQEVLRIHDGFEVAEYHDTVFNAPSFEHNGICLCSVGYSGNRCEESQRICEPNPCSSGGVCVPEKNGYFSCRCPPNTSGRLCEISHSDQCYNNPCLNGGTCKTSKGLSGTFCICHAGYIGNYCEKVVDTCAQNPCKNGGTCVSLKGHYRCRCPDHFYGNQCEFATLGFQELSFISLPSLNPSTNDVSIIFTTSKSQALLLYNFGQLIGGRSDFFAMELRNGKPRFSWGGARTAITTIELNKTVNTGRWYKLTATRINKIGTLSIEDCTESGEFCKACKPDDPSCFKKALGDAGTLAFHQNPLFFGGLSEPKFFFERNYQINSFDFVGCVKSLTINGIDIDFNSRATNISGITDTCNQIEGGACRSNNKCGDQGSCIPLWSRHMCNCEGKVASNCDSALQPFSVIEEDQLVYKPTAYFKKSLGIEPQLFSADELTSLGVLDEKIEVSFRTLSEDAPLLRAMSSSQSSTELHIEQGSLIFSSRTDEDKDVKVTLGPVSDGLWHNVGFELEDGAVSIWLDGEIIKKLDSYVLHNFFDKSMQKFILGGRDEKGGFRGCLANFTLKNEVQSHTSHSSYLSLEKGSKSVLLECDVQILKSTEPKSAISVGIIVIVVFFVLLICAICFSFTGFKLWKHWKAKNEPYKGHVSSSSNSAANTSVVSPNRDFTPEKVQPPSYPYPYSGPQQGITNQAMTHDFEDTMAAPGRDKPPPFLNNKPADPRLPSPYEQEMEHYDIENASSIAPSDIDIVHHYKGFRKQRDKHSPSRLRKKLATHQNTPLARLSPSSEMSRMTPRILTLKDLSRTNGFLAEEDPSEFQRNLSESSCSSPVSNMRQRSSPMKHSGKSSPYHRPFQPENLGSHPGSIKSSNKTWTGGRSLHSQPLATSSNLSSSDADSDSESDSFTCSEFDGNEGSDARSMTPRKTPTAPMVFSKISDNAQGSPRLFSDQANPVLSGDIYSKWESLLNWTPDYITFSGVFRDISELANSDSPECRVSPIGDHSNEQFI